MSKREKFDAENEGRRRVNLYMDGFRCGVNVGNISADATIDPLFTLGWKAGRDASRDAYEGACAFSGIKPTYVTLYGG